MIRKHNNISATSLLNGCPPSNPVYQDCLAGVRYIVLFMFLACHSTDGRTQGLFSYEYTTDSLVITCVDSSLEVFYETGLTSPARNSPSFYGSVRLARYVPNNLPVVSANPFATPSADDVDTTNPYFWNVVLDPDRYSELTEVNKIETYNLRIFDCEAEDPEACWMVIQLPREDLFLDQYAGLPRVFVGGRYGDLDRQFTWQDSCFDYREYTLQEEPYFHPAWGADGIDSVIRIDSFVSGNGLNAWYGVVAANMEGELVSVSSFKHYFNELRLLIDFGGDIDSFYPVDTIYLTEGSPGYFGFNGGMVYPESDSQVLTIHIDTCLSAREASMTKFPFNSPAIYTRWADVRMVSPTGNSWYEGKVKVRTQGQISQLKATPAFDLRFPKAHKFRVKLFEDGPKQFRRFYVRTGGSDQEQARFSDILYNRIARNLGVGAQEGQLVNLYFMGEDYGLYYLREKLDDHYVQGYYDIDNRDVMEYRYSPHGLSIPVKTYSANDQAVTDDWIAFLFGENLSDPSVIDSILGIYDLGSLFRSAAYDAMAANADANRSAVMYDKQRGRFFECIKDGDATFYPRSVHKNTFAINYWDDTVSARALILKRLLESDIFWNDWINTLSDVSTTTFQGPHMVSILDTLIAEVSPYLGAVHRRWGHLDCARDSATIREMLEGKRWFIQNREAYLDSFFRADHHVAPSIMRIQAKTTRNTGQQCWNENIGKVSVSSIATEAENVLVRKTYASIDTSLERRVTVKLEARGDNFLHWEESGATNRLLTYVPYPGMDTSFTAVFGCLETDPGIGQLRFAETVPDNATVTVDDYGRDGKDYLELHNPTSDTINLRGAYLSDKRHRLDKHRIEEDLFLAPDQRVVFFADEDSERGVYHLNFRLNKEGETVYLSYDGLSVTDSLQWGVTVPTDLSWSVCPAGNGIANATPGYGNDCPELPLSVPDPSQPGQLMVKLCPNPTSGPINITGAENTTAEVLSLSGKVLMSRKLEGYQEAMDLTGLPAGVYMIRFFRNGRIQGIGRVVLI